MKYLSHPKRPRVNLSISKDVSFSVSYEQILLQEHCSIQKPSDNEVVSQLNDFSIHFHPSTTNKQLVAFANEPQ